MLGTQPPGSTTWRETSSRELARVAMDDFPTAADAFFEIIDNPLDYRRGRRLAIDVWADKDEDLVVLEDRGGESMDDEGIADWLQWGSGHPHSPHDIGKYHKGGKAACGYLADSVKILTRRSGRSEIWMFEDLHWKSRQEWLDFGTPSPYTGSLPATIAALPAGTGFTRIELSNLARDRRYNLEQLKWRIGNTYRSLILDGAVTISLNGEVVPALDLPLSSAFPKRRIGVQLPSGRRVQGWIGRLDRDATKAGPHRIPGGLRCLYQGRLIIEGQFFGHHAEGKGLLASLVGEIELNFVDPLSNKTDFRRGTAMWQEVEEAMHAYLTPVIAEFRRAADAQPVTLEERKRVNGVRRQLEAAVRLLRGSASGEPSDDGFGRRPARRRRGHSPETAGGPLGARQPSRPRTPPPENAVGTLKRLQSRISPKGEIPPIILLDLDPTVRSETDEAAGVLTKIVINRRYPMYTDLDGDEAYIAETAILELLRPRQGEVLPVDRFLDQVNDCLRLWYKAADAQAA